MLQKFLLLLCLFSFVFINAQSSYELGYIIDNNGNKIECYIKNSDWISSPIRISYKSSIDSNEILISEINNMKEFGIGDDIVYKRYTVDIDKSSNRTSELSWQSEPEFITETLLLKQLVSGKANLYYYKGESIVRFFYSIDNDKTVSQLIYKKYKLNGNEIATNSSYKSKLFNELKCDDISSNDLRSLKYDKKDLINFFNVYNLCVGSTSKILEDTNRKGNFNYKIKGGVTFFNAEFKDASVNILATDLLSVDLSNEVNFRLGVEIEYVLPFNNNKWSIFIEPSYQSYKGTGVNRSLSSETIANFSYTYIDVPLGLRHYLFLNDTSSIFLNLAWVAVIDVDGEIKYVNDSFSYPIKVQSVGNIIFGMGYDYNSKLSVEARISAGRNVAKKSPDISSRYSGMSLILGYKLF